MNWSFLVTIALVLFAVNQVEKSIARRTADEIERRSKQQAIPKPKSRTRLLLEQVATGAFGLALFVGAIVVMSYGIAQIPHRGAATAQVSTDHTAQPPLGSPIPRPGSGS